MLPNSSLTIPLPRDQDRAALCRVTMSDMIGWDVSLEVNDRVLSVTHCSDWHRVERICGDIKETWTGTHTLPPVRR